MITIKDHPISIMVIYCVALHAFWSLMVSLNVEATNATPVAALYDVFHDQHLLASVLGSVAILAICAMFTRTPWVVWLLVPQQIMLLMSASGALSAIWLSEFADGVVRDRAFIAADQIHIVLAALGHSIAVIAHARSRGY